VARVLRPHGCRGEMRLLPLTDFPERFSGMKRVTVQKGDEYREMAVEGVRWHQKVVLMKLAGVDDPVAARTFQGAHLVVDRSGTVPLPADNYYVFDLIGLTVFSGEGRELGKISDVMRTGANDVYVVDRPGRRPLLIPALKRVVRTVDVAGGRMVVDLPEGLEET
jgi:16S rRNA processing protein RimM